MGDIYANAYVTLAADGAVDSSRGLFLNIVAQESRVHDEGRVFRFPSARRDQVPESSLSKRGWVLQEMALSPRVIHFSSDQIYWQRVESALTSEDNSLPASNSRHGGFVGNEPYPGSYDFRNPTRTWWDWCCQYSTRRLKYPADWLVAFVGVTRYHKQNIYSAPIVGLWRSNLHLNLLWRLGTRIVLPPPREWRGSLGIPSWSWLASNRELLPGVYDWIEDASANSDVIKSPYTSFSECEVVWTGEEFTSILSKAEIHGEGKILHLLLEPDENIFPAYRVVGPAERAYVGNGARNDSRFQAYFDVKNGQNGDRKLEAVCLLLAYRETMIDGLWEMNHFVLLLKEVKGAEGSEEEERYEGIGVGYLQCRQDEIQPKARVAARVRASVFIREASVKNFVLV